MKPPGRFVPFWMPRRRFSDSAVALAALVVALVVCAPGAAQNAPASNVGTVDLGGRLALKVLLSSEDALAASRYETDSRVDFETQQLGVRWRLGDHSWQPFVGVFAGRYADELTFASDTFVFESEFDAVTVGVEAGADFPLGSATRRSGWFLEPRLAAGYSWVEASDKLEFIAGNFFEASSDAESVTALAALGLGHRWQPTGTWHAEASVALWWLHTEPRSVDSIFVDDDTTTEHLRLHLAAVFPLSAQLAGYDLELATGLVHTELHDDIARLYASDRMTELSLSLLARVGDERLPVDAVGLAVRHLTADGFDGWTLGITVSD